MSVEELMEKGKKEFEKQKYNNAKKHFEKVVKLDPDNYEAWHHLGLSESLKGVKDKDIPKIRGYFEKATELKPDYSDAWRELASFYAVVEKKPTESLQYFQKALELNPEDAPGWNGLAVAQTELGNHENALECLQQALQLDPQNALYHFNMGYTYGNLGQFDNALEYYNKALEIIPNAWDVMHQMALLYHNKIKDYEKSIEYWERVKKLASWMGDDAKKYINEAKKILKEKKRDATGYGGMAG